MAEKIYSIQEISKLCNLTRRQLLYYEEKGLIQNVVRGDNNYRYYTKDHLAKLVFMKECREIGFSIETIDNLLKHNTTSQLKPAVHQAMAEARVALDKSVAKYQQSMERYHSLLEAAYISENTFLDPSQRSNSLVHLEAKNLVCLEYQGNFTDEPFIFYQHFAKLDLLVKDYGLTVISPKIYCFKQHFDTAKASFLDQKCQIKLAYEVKDDANAACCPRVAKELGFEAVFSICVGHNYADLKQCYQHMLVWGQEQGYKLASSSYEETLLDIGFSDFWVSKLYIPVIK